ncbi:MAG: hypothetical protein AB8G99_02155 [Planctomycetaceae bacterium]
MDFDSYNQEAQFRSAWDAVNVERAVDYSLFTFGDQDLPYFLVTKEGDEDAMVCVREGQVNVAKPRIITPDSVHPEFRNFFESEEEYGYVEFLLARTAAFGNLKITNNEGPAKIVTDTVAEAVAKLNQQLDDIEEEHTAVLSAPEALAGFAVLRYASERIMSSAPGNIQELRERGFLP